jgi:hypothetical protein
VRIEYAGIAWRPAAVAGSLRGAARGCHSVRVGRYRLRTHRPPGHHPVDHLDRARPLARCDTAGAQPCDSAALAAAQPPRRRAREPGQCEQRRGHDDAATTPRAVVPLVSFTIQSQSSETSIHARGSPRQRARCDPLRQGSPRRREARRPTAASSCREIAPLQANARGLLPMSSAPLAACRSGGPQAVRAARAAAGA